ncbi:MAG: protein phosphatase 2C domain-containing protein [Methylococcales bacterium]
MTDTTPFEWSSAYRSETGNIRSVNEDACLDMRHKGIWVVADGMGGHQSGDLASRSIVESLEKAQVYDHLDESLDDIKERLKQVNTDLNIEAAERGGNQTIGSTVVVMVAHEDQCAVVWAGDSRLYRYRDGLLERLTRDHSQVQEIIELGVLLPEDAENHPAANIITRAIGASHDIDLDSTTTTMRADDVYLLCSDGLYKELTEDEIASILLAQSDSKIACDELIDRTLQRECRDNVTAIVVNIWSSEKTLLRETEFAGQDPGDFTAQL